MDGITLKPCPFCGGEPEYIERGNEYMGIKETNVRCKRCNTKQVHKWIRMKFDFDEVRRLTVDGWNKRVYEVDSCSADNF